ncbi:unnamed protein product [Acanthoscelides obtectus]|uniref:Uncharacterized protein n=1 Tax=Acanthoscelides obtectus TaxID=200917 RepID=A0A9P0M5I5_ACAOB|nr:unnamed protein product [Acanthoscelides obtectus]CAK1623166.1 hypothetical protein AOBTE_LOCUS1849 [Acanthoscelides obtectus]
MLGRQYIGLYMESCFTCCIFNVSRHFIQKATQRVLQQFRNEYCAEKLIQITFEIIYQNCQVRGSSMIGLFYAMNARLFLNRIYSR